MCKCLVEAEDHMRVEGRTGEILSIARYEDAPATFEDLEMQERFAVAWAYLCLTGEAPEAVRGANV